MEHTISVIEEDPESPDALELTGELSDALEGITGRSGRASFSAADVRAPRALFAVARDENGKAAGCGALRPISDNIAEVKRMYARTKGKGIGSAVLSYLEDRALSFGYDTLRLETGAENIDAISFYERNCYIRIPGYGKYAGRSNCVCFKKRL